MGERRKGGRENVIHYWNEAERLRAYTKHTHHVPHTTHHTPEKFSNSSPLELFEPKGKNQPNKTKQLNWKVEQCGERMAGLLDYTWECRRGAQTQPCRSGGDAERRSPLPTLLAPNGFGPAPPVLYFAWREWLPLPPSLRGCHSTPTSCMTHSPLHRLPFHRGHDAILVGGQSRRQHVQHHLVLL